MIARHVLLPQDMSFDQRACMTCDHTTCLAITKHLVITKHALWSQDLSCDKTCFVITRHVLCSQEVCFDDETCIVLASTQCFVVTRHVL